MKTTVKYLAAASLIFTLFACSNPSLQKYYVEKQNDSDFISLDVSSSLFVRENNLTDKEQKEALKSIKKLNILALPAKDGNTEKYQEEKEKVASILEDKKYKTLITYGSNTSSAVLKYIGEETAIDEFVVFANDDERGLALFRVLGKDMNPARIMELITSLDNDSFDFSFLKNIEAELK